MKIVVEGNPYGLTLPGWVDKEFQCRVCGTIILLDESDISKGAGRYVSYGRLLLDCPVCNASSWFEHYSTWWRKLWRKFVAWNDGE